MDNFYRLNDEVVDEDIYQNVIAMMVTGVNRKRLPNDTFELTFHILQDEWNGWTRVSYISESHEQELKLQKLYDPVGTIVYMNRITKSNEGLDLTYDDEMAVVSLRPNVYQVQQFLKVSNIHFQI